MTDARWLSDEEQHVWRAYLDVSRLLTERLQHQLVRDSGMSLAEYEIFVQLSEAPGRTLRMSELAERAVNSRSRLTHTVSRLEARGLVRREPCPDDGRGVLCILTEEGFKAIDAAAPGHVEAVRSALFDPLGPEESRALGTAMEKILGVLREQ